jgi:hypothetical protein
VRAMRFTLSTLCWATCALSIVATYAHADTGDTDTGTFDTAAPLDTGTSDTRWIDTGVGDTGVGDTAAPDTGAAHTGLSDTGAPFPGDSDSPPVDTATDEATGDDSDSGTDSDAAAPADSDAAMTDAGDADSDNLAWASSLARESGGLRCDSSEGSAMPLAAIVVFSGGLLALRRRHLTA